MESGLTCLSGTGGCVYMKEENVYHLVFQGNKKPRFFLQLVTSNDCKDRNVCCKAAPKTPFNDKFAKTCTQFTGALIYTRRNYGFGSFRFFSIAAHHRTGIGVNELHFGTLKLADIEEIWSCFILEGPSSRAEMSISMCIMANDPFHAALSWENGGDQETRHVRIPMDASREIAIYRIDWTKDHISWLINGNVIGKIYASETSYPMRPLHIKSTLFPQLDVEKEIPVDYFINTKKIEVRMDLFRVTYIPQHLMNDKDELLVLGHFSSKHWTWIIATGLLLLAIIAFILFFKTRRRVTCNEVDSRYTLMNVE